MLKVDVKIKDDKHLMIERVVRNWLEGEKETLRYR
jgi:hypothetical protein